MQNLSYENEFDLHENEAVSRIHLHMNGFAQRQFGNGLLKTSKSLEVLVAAGFKLLCYFREILPPLRSLTLLSLMLSAFPLN